jgi:hypothetical protein
MNSLKVSSLTWLLVARRLQSYRISITDHRLPLFHPATVLNKKEPSCGLSFFKIFSTSSECQLSCGLKVSSSLRPSVPSSLRLFFPASCALSRCPTQTAYPQTGSGKVRLSPYYRLSLEVDHAAPTAFELR